MKTSIVKTLILEQFPEYAGLPITPVDNNGHDNDTYHLGTTMSIRLPSGSQYVAQIEKEAQWLPYLQKQLQYPIPVPIGLGKPSPIFPYPWAINTWITGETVAEATTLNKQQLAKDLRCFLKELQAIPVPNDAPIAGQHNFYRGGDLAIYHEETKKALQTLKKELDTTTLSRIWNDCLSVSQHQLLHFVHGDIAPGNLLVKNDTLKAVIDFGILGVGDPSCDYAMAWTYFDKDSRKEFLKGLADDWMQRAKGWALWKALITYYDANPVIQENARRTIREILNEEST